MRVVPAAILGVILAAAGLELVTAAFASWAAHRRAWPVIAVTAALALWSMAAALLAGVVVDSVLARRVHAGGGRRASPYAGG
jgi:hypothetical protein